MKKVASFEHTPLVQIAGKNLFYDEYMTIMEVLAKSEEVQVATLGYKNHKSCKILPKFSSGLHFLQEPYKFVQESQILQICYNVEHFLQDSDNIFCKKCIFLVRNSYKNCDVLIRPKLQKSSNYQQQQPQLPFTMHKLFQDPSKRLQIVNFEQDFTCNFSPEITITYSRYETPDKNSENSSANNDRNMNMIPIENTFQGLSNGSNPNLLSATVMEKISKNTTKPPVQCHIENYKIPENSSKIQLSVSFLLQPISTSHETAEIGGHCSLRGTDPTQGFNVVSF